MQHAVHLPALAFRDKNGSMSAHAAMVSPCLRYCERVPGVVIIADLSSTVCICCSHGMLDMKWTYPR